MILITKLENTLKSWFPDSFAIGDLLTSFGDSSISVCSRFVQ
jgi:hypothetical protein